MGNLRKYDAEDFNFVCLSRDIESGFAREIKLPDGKSYVVSRNKNHLSLSPNLCTHRGFPVLKEGEIKRLPISCPLHSNRFIPSEIQIREKGGAILLKDGPSTTEYWIGKLIENLGEQYQEETNYLDCPPELWLWGTMDPNHLQTVHPKGFAKMFAELPPKPEHIEIEPKGSSYSLLISDSYRERFIKALKVEGGLDAYFRHYVLYPNLSVTSFLGVFMSIETVTATNAGCVVRTRFFTSKHYQVPSVLIALAREGNRNILSEDADSCEQWAKGEPFSRPTAWMRGDERAKAYWEHLSAREFG